MGDVIGLQDRQLIENQEFVSDLARFSESLLTEKFIRRKYGNLDEASWTRLAENEELIAKIEDEKLRRTRDGSSKRELAQKHIVRGPDILNGIASDVSASPRHRVDALRTLDGMAANSPSAAAGQSDRYVIQINIGDTSLVFDKPITPTNVHDIDPTDTDTMSWEMSAAITAKKEDGGSGEPL